ncbi:MAG: NEW3 domain-containing protein [Candidatus Bathyarchaeum tardum]|nr:MAG: NEW3 domain-containing protein [Candidatus Bathyarchaeum tardum]
MDKRLQTMKNMLKVTSKLLLITALCSVSVIAVLFPSLSVYASTSNISGFLENENGEPLGLVKVQLLSGSSIIATSTSSSNGRFELTNINFGTYTLKFIKYGYAETEQTISLQNSETNVGTVVLNNAIELSSSTLSVITNPDAQISISFTIKNFGSSTQTVDLLTTNPDDWYSKISTNSYEIKKVSLTVGQSMSLQLDFIVPSTASIDNEYNVSVIAVGPVNSSFTFVVQIRNPSSALPTLNLHSPILSMVVNSGEKLMLPFTVKNVGDTTESIVFSITAPVGWSSGILNDNGREITEASLSSGASVNLNLELIIPLDYTGDADLTLVAKGNTVATLEFTFDVETVTESIMGCRFPGKIAVPGDIVAFDIQLTNPFNVETRFSVSVGSLPANWTASVVTQSGESINEIILGAGESISLGVQVQTLSSAISDKTYEVVIVAESGNQQISSLPLTVTLEGDASAVAISTKFPDITVEAGAIVEYSITVTNLGDANRLLLFSINAPSNWKAVVKSGNVEISRLSIDAGSSESFTIQVTPPSTVSLGSYDIDVQFTSESGALLGEKQLTATVVGAYSLNLSLSTLLKSTTSGDSVFFTATVTNTGYSYVTGVSLDFDAEDDWAVTISPTQVDMLMPQESCTFEVVVDTPSGTVSGDYMVTVGAVSDQNNSDQTQVRVTVNTSSSWAIYGIGIAAVLVLALVLVFKKFKRR